MALEDEVRAQTQSIDRLISTLGKTGGGGGGDGTIAKQGLLASATDKATAGAAKLAAGTATTSDVLGAATGVIGKFGIVGEKSAAVLQNLGEGAINVNKTLNDTGKFGVTFGQNLGEANLAIKGAQLTLPEFQSLIQQNGKSLAGLTGGQNDSAKTFLKLSTEMQGTGLAQELKAAGMSSLELNEALLTVSKSSGPINMQDVNSRKQLIASALQLSDEMNKTAELSGKSRKQQEAEIDAINNRADVEAATLAAMKVDPEFGNRMTSATESMSKFGPKFQELLAEEATGGARSEDALNTKAAMGEAGEAIAAYGKAVKSGIPEEIAAAKERAERAIAAKLADENFNKTIAITQGNVLNGAAIVKDSVTFTKNIMAEQAKYARENSGKQIDEYTAMKRLEERGELRTTGKTPEGKTDEGALVGRTINQIDNLGKVVGGTMATGFNKLNTELGHTIATQLPGFNAKLKAMGTPDALNKAAGDEIDKITNGAAKLAGVRQIAKDANTKDMLSKGPLSLRKETQPGESGTQTSAPTSAPASDANNGGILNEFKELFTQLNTKMGNIETNTKAAADAAGKNVRATENLSGNRLN